MMSTSLETKGARRTPSRELVAPRPTFHSTPKTADAVDLYHAKNLETDKTIAEKMTDLGAFMKKYSVCMVTTIKDGEGLSARCMGLAATSHDPGVQGFVISTNIKAIGTYPRINVAFLDVEGGQWASISGNASVITDKDYIHKYYTPNLRPWFGDVGDGVRDGGPDDPRIGMIKVEVTSAAYALTDVGMLGKKALDYKGNLDQMPRIHKLRKLTAAELDEWRAQNK